MVTTRTFGSASISKNTYQVIICICTNFFAFIKKCTILLIFWTMPLHYIKLNGPLSSGCLDTQANSDAPYQGSV